MIILQLAQDVPDRLTVANEQETHCRFAPFQC
jgi:hypothetical protein